MADGMLIDFEASAAVAMVDHQVAHVYCRGDVSAARAALDDAEGFLVSTAAEVGLTHRRAGDLVLTAGADTWFDYKWWKEEAEVPSFAGTVDIHRKPGYDPLELFWNPATMSISKDATLVRGSHGRADSDAILVGAVEAKPYACADVASVIQRLLN
jgi:hypothetical protein